MTADQPMTRPVVTLRDMTADDLEAVASLEAGVSSHPWSRSLFAGELDLRSDQRLWLVAIASAKLVGFAGLMLVGEDAHLMNIAVDPDLRGRRIGQDLLAEVLLAARSQGARHLTLEVRASNTAALALYRRFRLGPVGVRKAYYPDGEDALILWAHDIDDVAYGSMLASLVSGANDASRTSAGSAQEASTRE